MSSSLGAIDELLTLLYDNSTHALQCTAKRQFSITSEMEKK